MSIAVTVHAARNLAARDVGIVSATSDPYVIVKCGSSSHTTVVISKNLNPTWNEDCQLRGDGNITVEVWDKDTITRDEFLGMCVIDVRSAQSGPQWYSLTGRNGPSSDVTGDICISASAGGAPTGGKKRGPRGTKRNVRALVIGINYEGTDNALSGCINDATNSMSFIKSMANKGGYNFDGNLLTDYTPNRPTRRDVLSAMCWLVDGAQAGDILWFHYSGHGSQTEDEDGDEDDGMDETICTIDDNEITDDEIKAILCSKIPEDVTAYCIFDCCHSGTIMDLGHCWDGDSGRFVRDTFNPLTRANIWMISGCMNVQTSADLPEGYRPGITEAVGALTQSLLPLMGMGYSWSDMYTCLRRSLIEKDCEQIPQLETGRSELGDAVAFAELLPRNMRQTPKQPPPGGPLPPIGNKRVQHIESAGEGPYVGGQFMEVAPLATTLFSSFFTGGYSMGIDLDSYLTSNADPDFQAESADFLLYDDDDGYYSDYDDEDDADAGADDFDDEDNEDEDEDGDDEEEDGGGDDDDEEYS